MKFKLTESSVLTEALSSSIPRWLKPVFIAATAFRGNSYNGTSGMPYYGSNYGRQEPDYRKRDTKVKSYYKNFPELRNSASSGQRYFTGRGSNARGNLAIAIADSDIKIDSAVFIEDEPPKNTRDKRLDNPDYQCFFLIESPDRWGDIQTQIYAPGLNDKEESIIQGYTDKTYKYISYKNILPFVKKFCYIDMTKPESKKSSRMKYSNVPDKDRRYITGAKTGWWNPYPVNDKLIDKSGYITNPDKYKDILKKNNIKNYSKYLDALYDDLSNLREAYIEAVSSTDIMDSDTDFGYWFRESVDDYKRLLKSVEEYNKIQDEDTRASKLVELFEPGKWNQYTRCLDRIKEAQKQLGNFRYDRLDW